MTNSTKQPFKEDVNDDDDDTDDLKSSSDIAHSNPELHRSCEALLPTSSSSLLTVECTNSSSYINSDPTTTKTTSSNNEYLLSPRNEEDRKDNAKSVTSSSSHQQRHVILNPYKKTSAKEKEELSLPTKPFGRKRCIRSISKRTGAQSSSSSSSSSLKKQPPQLAKPRLQSGLVLDNDESNDNNNDAAGGPTQTTHDNTSWQTVGNSTIASTYIRLQQETTTNNGPITLYHDPDFKTLPASIEGVHMTSKSIIKCRCSPAQPAALSYSKGTGKKGIVNQPYYHCGTSPTIAGGRKKCRFFKWAYQAQLMHWYRFGRHNHHTLVHRHLSLNGGGGYAASDLVQGKVGDCWFLSALAVIAERPDLIRRLFPNDADLVLTETHDAYGIIEVKLFMDGYWKSITMDTFLPCLMEYQSVEPTTTTTIARDKKLAAHGGRKGDGGPNLAKKLSSSSGHEQQALSDTSRTIIRDTKEFLQQDREKKMPSVSKVDGGSRSVDPVQPYWQIGSCDLAYSKSRQNQLWVPYLEKAYAKIHGSYHAISGGHIAEAFLDLTGAPTLVYNFDNAATFNPKRFWSKLLSYRHQRLPMGCGTSTSQVGIVGGHAYSILDVREVTNVGVEFFTDKLLQGTLGGVSGFTEYDGTVRLLRIRNPHGQGEWKGQFSDGSSSWEKLLEHHHQTTVVAHDGKSTTTGGAEISLERTMENDGTFWIDYDSFLMGFSNVDVVLAFQGNHAKSFASNFPPKKSTHRCTRAFEVSMLDNQPGMASMESVDLYVMLIQKTRRGASRGRVDRKKSYKICDMGVFVAKSGNTEGCGDSSTCCYTQAIDAKMLGLSRVGHHRVILNRLTRKSVVVMPISFGHPAATDKLMSFTVRFVSDAPLMIRELPEVPRMDRVLHKFCMESTIVPSPYYANNQRQGQKIILLDGAPRFRVFLIDCTGRGGSESSEEAGGVVFFYLFVNDSLVNRSEKNDGVSFSMNAKCRGMVCRTEEGLLEHEKMVDVAPRKKFVAAWRQYKRDFAGETMSRLLMVLVQSGQDCEFRVSDASCCKLRSGNVLGSVQKKEDGYLKDYFRRAKPFPTHSLACLNDDYTKRGIFAQVVNEIKEKNDYIYPDTNTSIDMTIASGAHHFVDSELENILSISRRDTELQRVLEMSKQHNTNSSVTAAGQGYSEDLDLQRAIEMSKQGLIANQNIPDSNRNRDSDLAKAIQLSLGGNQDKQSYKATDKDTIIDVDMCSMPVQKSPDDLAEVIEIFDEEEINIPIKQQQEDGKNISLKCSKESDNKAVEEKRKHAFEAAMKRFSTK